MTMWDWKTLIFSMRHYKELHTDESRSFPGEIVARFWGKGDRFTAADRGRIIRQCCNIEFRPVCGFDEEIFSAMDEPWLKFAAFVLALGNGTKMVRVLENGQETVKECFEFREKYFPIQEYIARPDDALPLDPESVVGVSSGRPSPDINEK